MKQKQGYNKIFRDLIAKLATFNDIFDENLHSILEDSAHLLHIAKIELKTFHSQKEEKLNKKREVILYQNGNIDENNNVNSRFVADSGVVMIFDAFGMSGAKTWDSIENEKIQILMMILFTFAERNREMDEIRIDISQEGKYIQDLFPQAIANEEFQVYYQPKVVLKDYKLIGAEALCRWRHDGKLLSACDFIYILEKNDFICELDFYMLEHVCRDIRSWLDKGKEALKVSINLSRKNFHTPNLADKIISVLNKYKIPHHLIEIEIAETADKSNRQELEELVNHLRSNKISSAIDDFGTDFSSLSLIRNLPWSVIKIDRSLLPKGKDKTTKQYTMLKHLLSMLHDMGFKCVVEGVETKEEVNILKENNCYVAQGFYFDRPLSKNDFETRLEFSKDKASGILEF